MAARAAVGAGKPTADAIRTALHIAPKTAARLRDARLNVAPASRGKV